MQYIFERILKVKSKIFLIIHTLLFKFRFKEFGRKSTIGYGCILQYPQHISIGEKVTIANNVWLNAGPKNNNPVALLIIGSGSYIGRNSHINAFNNVVIEEHVLIGDDVYLGDTDHISNENSELPIIKQGWESKANVLLKTGCYISKGAIILPGVIIGKNAVVGPNSVITMNVPDYALAWGNPARIIKVKELK